MEQDSNINPHCNKPHIVKDGLRWSIRFYFTVDGIKKAKKMADGLNDSDYIRKVNGKNIEYNKVERKQYANTLIASYTARLKKDYFNPYTLEFVVSDRSQLPFKQYLEDYINYTPRRKRSESTKGIYRSYNNVINAFLIGRGTPNIKLSDVSREIIEMFLADIESKDSTQQRDNYLTYLKGVFKYCQDYLEVISKSPLKLIHRINTDTSKTNKAYGEELREQVLVEAKKLDLCFWILLRMIYHTLRRPDELLSLQYRNFDLKAGSVSFTSDMIKTNKPQYSNLSSNLINDIKSLCPADVNSDYYFLGSEKRVGASKRYSKAVFAVTRTPYEHFKDKFKTLQKRMKLDKGFTIYSFKHTGVVYMIEKDRFSDQEIIEHTGHTDVKILGRYARDAKRERKQRSDNV